MASQRDVGQGVGTQPGSPDRQQTPQHRHAHPRNSAKFMAGVIRHPMLWAERDASFLTCRARRRGSTRGVGAMRTWGGRGWAAGVVLALVLAGCGSKGAQNATTSGDVLNLGASMSLRGALEKEGKLTQQGYDYCVNTINGALGTLSGVEAVSTDIPTKTVRVRYDPGQLSMEQIETVLDDAGYTIAK